MCNYFMFELSLEGKYLQILFGLSLSNNISSKYQEILIYPAGI